MIHSTADKRSDFISTTTWWWWRSVGASSQVLSCPSIHNNKTILYSARTIVCVFLHSEPKMGTNCVCASVPTDKSRSRRRRKAARVCSQTGSDFQSGWRAADPIQTRSEESLSAWGEPRTKRGAGSGVLHRTVDWSSLTGLGMCRTLFPVFFFLKCRTHKWTSKQTKSLGTVKY